MPKLPSYFAPPETTTTSPTDIRQGNTTKTVAVSSTTTEFVLQPTSTPNDALQVSEIMEETTTRSGKRTHRSPTYYGFDKKSSLGVFTPFLPPPPPPPPSLTTPKRNELGI